MRWGAGAASLGAVSQPEEAAMELIEVNGKQRLGGEDAAARPPEIADQLARHEFEIEAGETELEIELSR